MLAIPGLLLLLMVLVARPTDMFPVARAVPFVQALSGLALLGYLVDARQRITRVRTVPSFAFAGMFFAWAGLITLIKSQEKIENLIQLAILALVYFLVAHGIRSFKALEASAFTLLACSVLIGVLCVHLGMQSTECVAYLPGEDRLTDAGHPDGRACEFAYQCSDQGLSGADYTCEKASGFGLTTVAGGRVRYVGTLADPNEVAMVLSALLPFAFALRQRRASRPRTLLLVAALFCTAAVVYLTGSRSGALVFLTVLGTYAARRFGIKRLLVLGTVPLMGVAAVLVARARSRTDAGASSEERLDNLYAGLEMFQAQPITGVGVNEFLSYHHLQAHNSYLQAASETGIIGMLLWTGVFYVSLKTLIVGTRRYRAEPRARVAVIWGDALTTSLLGVAVGVFFLTFNYHHLLWISLGLAGAFYTATKLHDDSFTVEMTWRDLVLLLAGNGALLVAIKGYILLETWVL